MPSYDINQKLLCVTSVTAASGWLGTTAVDLVTLLAKNYDQQTLLITNNHASNTVYVGFISTMTSGGGWNFKLASGIDKSIQVGPDQSVYALASATSSLVTVVRGC